MDPQRPTSVIGAGAWGTALARLLANKGVPTLIWAHEPEVVHDIRTVHENRTFLSGFDLGPDLEATGDLDEALERAEVVVNAVPTQHMRSVLQRAGSALAGTDRVVTVSKGIELGPAERGFVTVQQRYKVPLPHFSLGFLFLFCSQNAFATGKLFVGEKSGATAPHLQNHCIAHKAVVAKEKEQALTAFGKRVDADIVAQRVAFQRNVFQKRKRTIQQAINPLALVLEIDTQIADEH